MVYNYRVAALEFGPKQIRVNAVNPTVTMTAMAKVLNFTNLAVWLKSMIAGWLVRPSKIWTYAGQNTSGKICWGGGCCQLYSVSFEWEICNGEWSHITHWWRIPCYMICWNLFYCVGSNKLGCQGFLLPYWFRMYTF